MTRITGDGDDEDEEQVQVMMTEDSGKCSAETDKEDRPHPYFNVVYMSVAFFMFCVNS